MNYYIVTEEVFNTLTKENISFMHKSMDGSKRLIITTDTVSSYTTTFSNSEECSQYTFSNHSDWVGDGSGIEEEEFENMPYVSEVDD